MDVPSVLCGISGKDREYKSEYECEFAHSDILFFQPAKIQISKIETITVKKSPTATAPKFYLIVLARQLWRHLRPRRCLWLVPRDGYPTMSSVLLSD
jgi:hypothetical protein